MVEGKKKSRSKRRVKIVTPSQRNVIHYEPRTPQQPRCAETGQRLHGIPRVSKSGIARLPKTMRRPERRYGGVLSSKSARRKLIMKARQ